MEHTGHLKGLIPSYLQMNEEQKLSHVRAMRLDRTIRKRVIKKKAASKAGGKKRKPAAKKKTQLKSLDKLLDSMTQEEQDKMQALLIRDLGGQA